ncbi:MAG: hypothetical protein RMI43_07060 [Candidatus Caldarchaeum sp.]|nr:hypothetical protein [Candidatus Caldarchaeum sp.]MDW8063913.1 hypothetical protein [Candidatus Caldarchaeum sp.]MDW8434779.1 hypothetical protein [Candidatus Caldarchaeum sp.]
MAGEEADYWIIKIPKPRRFIRVFAKVLQSVGAVFYRTFSVDLPLIFITSVLIGVVLFITFTVVFRIPDLVAGLFTVLLVGVYLFILRREMLR